MEEQRNAFYKKVADIESRLLDYRKNDNKYFDLAEPVSISRNFSIEWGQTKDTSMIRFDENLPVSVRDEIREAFNASFT